MILAVFLFKLSLHKSSQNDKPNDNNEEFENHQSRWERCSGCCLKCAGETAVGAAVGSIAFHLIITALGFAAGGIVGGSIGAWLMSIVAILHGGGVPAGSILAILQRIGAKGLAKIIGMKLGIIFAAADAHDVCFNCIECIINVIPNCENITKCSKP
jgi:hypothetical protein